MDIKCSGCNIANACPVCSGSTLELRSKRNSSNGCKCIPGWYDVTGEKDC